MYFKHFPETEHLLFKINKCLFLESDLKKVQETHYFKLINKLSRVHHGYQHRGWFFYISFKKMLRFHSHFFFLSIIMEASFLASKNITKKEWEQNKWKHVHQNIDESINLKECNKKYVNQNTITLLSKLLHQCQSLKRDNSRNGRCWNYFVYMASYVYYSFSKKRRKSKTWQTNKLLTVSSYFLDYLPNLQIRIIFDTGKFNFIVASMKHQIQ